ncbi:hypothetical protein BHS07_18330 [Myxococcus xanthus]|nr:hypothetical protein BHS07_18330 [Myxococcus xanthus]
MSMFERRGPLDVIVKQHARMPKREWLKLQVIRNRERASGAVSPLTGRKVSRNDTLWAIVVRGLADYEKEHGPIVVSEHDALDDGDEDAKPEKAPRTKKAAKKTP